MNRAEFRRKDGELRKAMNGPADWHESWEAWHEWHRWYTGQLMPWSLHHFGLDQIRLERLTIRAYFPKPTDDAHTRRLCRRARDLYRQKALTQFAHVAKVRRAAQAFYASSPSGDFTAFVVRKFKPYLETLPYEFNDWPIASNNGKS